MAQKPPRLSYTQRLSQFPMALAPNDDAARIKGNLPLDQKQLLANVLAYHVADRPGSNIFGHEAAGKLRLVEANIRKTDAPTDGGAEATVAETVHEVTIEEGMLNVHGGLSGPCAVHFLDFATFSTLFCHGLVTQRDAMGVSSSMNVSFHAPSKSGATLRIICTTVATQGHSALVRGEVYDKGTGNILLSMGHTITPFEKPKGKL